MEKLFNIYHYCIFILLNKLHLFVNKIDIVLLFFKIPYFKEKLKKKNLDLVKIDEELWMNKENGLNIWGADAVFGFSFLVVLLSLFLIFTKNQNVDNMLWPFAGAFIIISVLAALRYGSNNGKYLDYYNEFEHWSSRERKKFLSLSMLFILGIMVLFFASLYFHFSSGIFQTL